LDLAGPDSRGSAFEITAIHHIGVSVRSVDEALGFWQRFLGVEPLWRRKLDDGYLSAITGYPEVVLDGCVIELCGGVLLELLDYKVRDKAENDMGTSSPGNTHISLRVSNLDAAWRRAVDNGAVSVSPGPVDITSGPNAGGRACYLRVHDGVTIELVQPAPTLASEGIA
jgi:catechol 2,3-dioxygenase-like lactoylglutathione lyase family enzyme